ncbi:MAG TPA: L-seryl-tRNA(Sec) selenium transferase [Burkholderiaceae bacterium]|jgi:L-seryl-tRNA(Ser) seleniumtransferase|nr:L-seryl-tRNA(Sec) selenium transferase [Burkholderiaceae bacterium]
MAGPVESIVDGSKATLLQLPSVDRLLRLPVSLRLIEQHGHTLVADQCRALLAGLRERAGAGLSAGELGEGPLQQRLQQRCEQALASKLRRVINLTGTVIHTNLGRALLADEAIAQIVALTAAPNNLEFDLRDGGRGERDSVVEPLLRELTGAEAATVVNNNAAAVLLTLAALARGRQVVVSRGELVEIGGSFRMPDVMRAAGARLLEVGTTNATHLADYRQAISARTALIMKVHTSNYAIAGFTSSVGEAQLAPLAQAAGIALACDLGSGSLIDLSAYGLPREPMPRDMIEAGCDVVTFSGDKLLGGPQAGLIVGREQMISRIRAHPLKRALRISKLPLAALEATLRLYLAPEKLPQRLPTLRLLCRSQTSIRALAEQVAEPLRQALSPRYAVQVADMESQIGSGSLPVDRLASAGLRIVANAVRRKGVGTALNQLADALRALPEPVIGRISDDALLLDLRCLEDPARLLGQMPALAQALRS